MELMIATLMHNAITPMDRLIVLVTAGGTVTAGGGVARVSCCNNNNHDFNVDKISNFMISIQIKISNFMISIRMKNIKLHVVTDIKKI